MDLDFDGKPPASATIEPAQTFPTAWSRAMIRLVLTLAIPGGLCWACESLRAVDDDPAQQSSSSESRASDAATQAATARRSYSAEDLQQLKRSGWERSRYRGRLPQSQDTAADLQVPQPQLERFQQKIGPILQRSCVDCHGADQQEGNMRIDTLDPNLHTGKDVDWWNEIFAVISKGEMPPPDSLQLADEERGQIVEWLSSELQAASVARRQSARHATFRRMTRYEFNYALQDLLGLPWDFAKDLPPDAQSDESFQNSAELLHMSVSQFETYHRLARAALARATVTGEKPPKLVWGITMGDASRLEWPKQEQQLAEAQKKWQEDPERLQPELDRLTESFRAEHPRTYYRDTLNGRTAVATWNYDGARYAQAPLSEPRTRPNHPRHVALLPARQWLNIELGNQLPDEGTLRVRVRAAAAKPRGDRAPSLQLYFGWQASNEGRALVRVSQADKPVAAEPDAAEFYEWDVPLGEIYPRNSARTSSPMGAIPSPSEYIRFVNSSASPDAILIDYVEVEAPVFDHWPPPSHQRIFSIDASVVDETEQARQLVHKFMAKAWRRPIRDEELLQKMKLFALLRPDCARFEDAVVEVLATVLASPNFLYVVQEGASAEPPADAASSVSLATSPDTSSHKSSGRTRLSSFELATRLSMFLWCSIPDEELLQLARDGRLGEATVLTGQVQRMLADPRSQRFSEQFVQQWLDMEQLEFINFKEHVRNFDPLLKEAMQREPIELFAEMLSHNETVLNFIHADYALVNERLAKHYGIRNVYGNHFRRVSLNGDVKRGGLLTQAGTLAMNADFPDSHPLKRGKWLLVSLLNDPPPPPPPAVPQIDLANPEIAKMTLKERIEDHRNHAACMACHIKIDPWGIAFENYDALGQWRESIQGKPVDAASELFNKQSLDGIDGLKHYLLENRQDQFVGAMVHKVTSYALGRPLKFTDRADLESITARVREQGDGLATLITAVATSDLFLSK